MLAQLEVQTERSLPTTDNQYITFLPDAQTKKEKNPTVYYIVILTFSFKKRGSIDEASDKKT